MSVAIPDEEYVNDDDDINDQIDQSISSDHQSKKRCFTLLALRRYI